MDKPWFKSYPKGVPHEINPEQYESLVDLFEVTFREYPDQPAFENMGKVLTYKDVDNLSASFAAYLQHDCGLKKDDKIAIMMPNVLQYPIALLGALRAGLVVVNTNPLYTPGEMLHQFTDSESKAIVILENFASNLQKIVDQTSIKHVVIASIGGMIGGLKGAIVNFVVRKVKKMVPAYSLPGAVRFQEALNKGKGKTLERPKIKPKDIAFLQYTGGTTGVSKGAMLTHRNMVANLEQANAWVVPGDLKPQTEIFITALPLYHIFALTANLCLAIKLGAKNVLITNPRDMAAFLGEMKKHKYSLITGVNTLFIKMLNHPKFKEIDHSNCKVVLAGGMALQRYVLEEWEKLTGFRIAEAYGLTETSPGVCINPLDGNIQIGSIGLPIPSTDIKLIDEDGKEVKKGEKGELCIKGPQVMAGYWKKPDETKLVMTDDDYFKSGDIAVMLDGGFFKIVDRKKEMILVSGFNVYPNEVEDAIAMHPKVLEVGAIGVPDKSQTEAVKVFVVKKDKSLTIEELNKHCDECLTGYKQPKYIEFVDELPKSNIGKILRRVLKEEDAKVNSYD